MDTNAEAPRAPGDGFGLLPLCGRRIDSHLRELNLSGRWERRKLQLIRGPLRAPAEPRLSPNGHTTAGDQHSSHQSHDGSAMSAAFCIPNASSPKTAATTRSQIAAAPRST
eukprot:1488438-Prymnesium_polylepis.2